MRSAALVLLAAAALVACSESGPPSSPPEGWVSEGNQWWVPGTDTSAAFRNLSTLEAMEVVREDEPEFVRWVQERMTDLYRTNPEVVDSVFGAEYLDAVREGVPNDENYATVADILVNDIKTAFFQRYNAARYSPPADPLAIPADLQGTSGQVTVQVYVNPDKEPVAVELLEGTGTELDQIAMRRAIEGSYTDAWVRPTAGPSAGVNVPSWVRVSSSFGE